MRTNLQVVVDDGHLPVELEVGEVHVGSSRSSRSSSSSTSRIRNTGYGSTTHDPSGCGGRRAPLRVSHVRGGRAGRHPRMAGPTPHRRGNHRSRRRAGCGRYWSRILIISAGEPGGQDVTVGETTDLVGLVADHGDGEPMGPPIVEPAPARSGPRPGSGWAWYPGRGRSVPAPVRVRAAMRRGAAARRRSPSSRRMSGPPHGLPLEEPLAPSAGVARILKWFVQVVRAPRLPCSP